MNPNLATVRKAILRDADPATLLIAVESGIRVYQRAPDSLVLPKDHKMLLPLIEAFAGKPAEFAEFVRSIRDDLEDSLHYEKLNTVFRRIFTKGVTMARRRRPTGAVLCVAKQLKKIGRELEYRDKLVVANVLEKAWGAKRLQALRSTRSELRVERLTEEQKEDVLADYWRKVDKSIERGDPLKMLGLTIDDILEVLA
jgi:hypothetical protein